MPPIELRTGDKTITHLAPLSEQIYATLADAMILLCLPSRIVIPGTHALS